MEKFKGDNLVERIERRICLGGCVEAVLSLKQTFYLEPIVSSLFLFLFLFF